MRTYRNTSLLVEPRGRIADNLRRILNRLELTPAELAAEAGLDYGIVRGLLSGAITKPQAPIVEKLVECLLIDPDELAAPAMRSARQSFDRRTNPLVDETRAEYPHLFDGWTPAEFNELYSRFGAGGELSADGVLRCVETINRNRETQAKLVILLETDYAERLTEVIDRWYEEATAIGVAGGHPG